MNALNAQDFSSLQTAFDAAKRTGQCLYIPKADYWLDEPIRISRASERPITVVGDWPTIRARRSMRCLLTINGPAKPFQIERVIFDGNDCADYGLQAYQLNSVLSTVRNVRVKRTKKSGFQLEKCMLSVWSGNEARNCGEHGFVIVDCNAALFQACRALNCVGSGFVIGGRDWAGGCTLSAFTSEGNQEHGVLVTARGKAWVPIRLENGWLERNGYDSVFIQSDNIVVHGLGISINKRVNSSVRSIRVTAESRGCHITSCYVPPRRPIRVEGDPAMHTIGGNYYRDGTAADVERP
jgi:hypothetical protein